MKSDLLHPDCAPIDLPIFDRWGRRDCIFSQYFGTLLSNCVDHRVKEAVSITITSDSSDNDSEEAEAALFLLPLPGLSRLLHLSSCWHTQRTSANLNIEDIS